MPTRDYTHLTPPELIELLRRRDAQAHFGLVWERDEIEYDRKLNDDFVGLVMDSAKSFGSPPYEHLIIEGDNFDALRHLLMTHAGRINVIVADPSYNTGNTSRRQGWFTTIGSSTQLAISPLHLAGVHVPAPVNSRTTCCPMRA